MLCAFLYYIYSRHKDSVYLFGFQKWPYFGTYQSKREEKISELKKQTHLLADELKPPPTSYFEPVKPVPAIKDVIGRALPMIGPYKRLDNEQQVVALIDDVSEYKHIEVAAASDNTVQLLSTSFFQIMLGISNLCNKTNKCTCINCFIIYF